MTLGLPQNPGIGGLDELTPAEEAFLTSLAGLPYVDGDVLPLHPYEAIQNGIAKNIEVLAGTNEDEKVHRCSYSQGRAGTYQDSCRKFPGTGDRNRRRELPCLRGENSRPGDGL